MPKKQTIWTKEMVDFIRENSDKLTNKEIAVKLETSECSVSSACRRYKIKKDWSSIRKRLFKEGKIIHPNTGKKIPEKQIEKRLDTIKRKYGKLKAWNKNLQGKEYLKHYKEGKVWNDGLTKEDPRVAKNVEKRTKSVLERGSLRGKNHPMYGKTKENSKWARRNSERMKKNNPNKNGRLWKIPEYREKVKKSMNLKPNKSEKIIINIIKENNFPFKYVGDFSYWIENFNPDFISTNGDKKIIEFNGTHWHDMEEHRERDRRKLIIYKKNNYELLIIESPELKNPIQIINKIKNFIK